MNRPLHRAEIEQFAELLAEKRRRQAKKLQQTRGYRDQRGVWRGGLLEFVRYFWSILEPGQKFVDGWALEAVVEHLEAVTFGEINNLLINVPPGFMKACDCDTSVLTTKGWKRHGDLRVGDSVFGADGLPKPVLARTQNAEEPCYEVKFDDGSSAIVGAGHLWEVDRDLPNQNAAKRGGWKRVRKVVATPDLKVPKAGAARRSADRIAITSPVQTSEAHLPIDPYLLGAWLGDGWSGGGVLYCGSLDLHHFVQLGRQTTGTNTAHRIHIDGLTTKLRNVGLLNNKHIPPEYLRASSAYRWAVLQGLMDTDGHADKDGGCSFTTVREHLADQFMQLACSLGLKPRMNTPTYSKVKGAKKIGPYYRVRFKPHRGAPIFRLARKQSRISTKELRGVGHRYVVSVDPVGMRMVNCIQVPDNLYLITDRFIVTHNSLLTDVMWPAWEWGPMAKPHLRYVAFSYSASLTERDNGRFKDLLSSSEYQAMYGSVVHLRKTGETKVSNWKHGWKLATSVGGVGTGERGNRAIIDDPHNVKESESKAVRQETIRWFRESLSSRLNNMETDAKIVIMQRVNEEDVAGEIITSMDGWCHLLIPMEYVWQADDNGDPYATDIGWVDPRWRPTPQECDGELAWEGRFPARIIPGMKKDVGPFGWSSQYQQTPETRGGSIFERDWWQPWQPADGKFPVFTYIVVSTDSAFGAKENSDPSASVCLGIFENEHGFNRVMVIEAWRRNLKFSGPVMTPFPGEKGMAFLERQRKGWGLVEWLADTCTRRKADRLLIENKASGISAAQSLANSHPHAGWAVQLIEPKGDKWARAQSVQPTFSQEMVHIPWPLRQWGSDLVDEMAIFPKGKHDDLTDAMTQGIKHLRDIGLLRNDSEIRQDLVEAAKPKGRPKKLYPGTAGKAA